MSKFKVGDLVKIVKPMLGIGKEKYINQIHKIIKNDTLPGEEKQWCVLDDDSPFRWREDELELVGKVTKKINKKEGNEMIESINLIDLYARKAEEKLVKDNAIKNAKIRNNDVTTTKFNEIMENTITQLEELYTSQLDEKDLLKFREGKKIDSGKYPFVRFGEIGVTMSGAMIDPNFTNDEIVLNSLELSKKIDELHDLVKIVKAHVGIAKSKEEVEEILTRYGIIDKKGKLVIK